MATRTGTAARIREILVTKDQITAVEIALKLGLPTRTVSNAITGMAGVFRFRKNNRSLTFYSTRPFAHAPVKRKKNVAPKHYHDWRTPEITRESYNLYEGRDLALCGR